MCPQSLPPRQTFWRQWKCIFLIGKMHFLYDKHQEGVLDNEPSKTTKIFESGSLENWTRTISTSWYDPDTLSSNHDPDVVSDWCTRVTRVTLSECKLRKQMKQLKSRTWASFLCQTTRYDLHIHPGQHETESKKSESKSASPSNWV